MNCPPYPAACVVPGSYADGGTALGAKGASGDVTVLKREVVGPYDVAQLKATDANALQDWATKNGFVIRDEQKPVIAAYQAEHFNFLAVKLVPGAGVQDMRPIRVTTKGANLALPLRMVAVGAGATLGITLWVLAETRFEPTNFTTFAIATDELAWDWTANKSNYLDLRASKTAAANGRAWEVESSITMPALQLRSAILRGSFGPSGGVGAIPYPDGGASAPDYEPDGQRSAEEVRDEDVATLLDGLSSSVRVTRLRADLAIAALDQDLVLGASGDRSELSSTRQITRELNEPLCPVYSSCRQVGTAPRSQAAAQTNANPNDASSADEDDGCSTSRAREGQTWLFALAGLFAFSLQRKFRRRRS
jgi:hypothetical protein